MNCEVGSKTALVALGTEGSASEVRAPLAMSIEYIPQTGATRNLPLAGEVMLLVLQLEPNEELEMAVSALQCLIAHFGVAVSPIRRSER
jgi:hypothetical protein